MPQKVRLDVAVFQRGLAPSREKAQRMIMAGEVLVDGKVRDKPGFSIKESAQILVKDRPQFVSRGGEKLAGALSDFKFNPAGLVCADVGASTGGFTDCLLQSGAERVYAIDVGYGQMDYRLRQDERVVVMERSNARYVQQLPEPIDLVVVDVSFISLRILLPVIKNWLDTPGHLITLIKPQFEAGKQDVGKGGVVRDPVVHRRVLMEFCEFVVAQSFTLHGLTRSSLKGPAGNVEFLAWLGWGLAEPAIGATNRINELVPT